MVEQVAVDDKVPGSSPGSGAIIYNTTEIWYCSTWRYIVENQVDRRRLRDGAEALALNDRAPKTLEEMEAQLQALRDGAVALQSTDDLGSLEANERVWNDMLELQRRAQALEKRIAELKTQRK
jgi:hypothetical protein